MENVTRPHPDLSVERSGAVLTITLDVPDRLNAQRPSLWAALARVAADLDPQVRVVVLRGAGRAFSAGIDRRIFGTEPIDGDEPLGPVAVGGAEALDDRIADYQRGFTCWREVDALVVAGVQGHAIGGGFQLALAADVRVVAEDVQFSMAEVKLGIVPDLGGTGRLTDLVGPARALDLCATGRRVGAAEASAIGLAERVAGPDGLDAAVEEFVESILANPEDAVREMTRLMRGAPARSAAEQLAAERAAQTRVMPAAAARVAAAPI